jgi:hypothetical protein
VVADAAALAKVLDGDDGGAHLLKAEIEKAESRNRIALQPKGEIRKAESRNRAAHHLKSRK